MRYWVAFLVGVTLFCAYVGVVWMQQERVASLGWLAGCLVSLWAARTLHRRSINREPAAPGYALFTSVPVFGVGASLCGYALTTWAAVPLLWSVASVSGGLLLVGIAVGLYVSGMRAPPPGTWKPKDWL